MIPAVIIFRPFVFTYRNWTSNQFNFYETRSSLFVTPKLYVYYQAPYRWIAAYFVLLSGLIQTVLQDSSIGSKPRCNAVPVLPNLPHVPLIATWIALGSVCSFWVSNKGPVNSQAWECSEDLPRSKILTMASHIWYHGETSFTPNVRMVNLHRAPAIFQSPCESQAPSTYES